jgi:hypothetical protein
MLRSYLLYNSWIKVGSLLLATLIWLAIHYRIMGPYERPVTHFLPRLPITVLADARNTNAFQVVPSEVVAVVRGPARLVERLNENDIEVFVNVTGKENPSSPTHRVEVVAPKGVEVIRTSPTHVIVQRVPNPLREPTPLRKP